MATWRDDQLNPGGYATPESVQVCAEDELERRDIYTLVIVHCVGWRGKGFMPSVRLGSSPRHNGNVHPGTGEEAYKAAQDEGERLLTQQLEELAQSMAKYAPRSG